MFVERGKQYHKICSETQMGQTLKSSSDVQVELERLLGPDFVVIYKRKINELDSAKSEVVVFADVYFISDGAVEYQVCPSQFKIMRGYYKPIVGDGFFNGDLDDIGMKIFNFCFSDRVGSTIYFNEFPMKITKLHDGSIYMADL